MTDPNIDSARLPPSLWAKISPDAPVTTRLTPGQPAADLLVIGAGFTGLSTALHAAKRGARVVLLEAADIGWGASGRNNGLVIPAMTRADPDLILKTFGPVKGESLVQLIGDSGNHLFNLVRELGIECDAHQKGWIQPAHRMSRLEVIRNRYAQWQARGADVEWLSRERTREIIGSELWYGAWQNKTGGRINPLAFARGLARAAQSYGVDIFTRSPVNNIEPADGSGWKVSSSNAYIKAAKVVLATHSYTDHFGGTAWPNLEKTMLPVRSYQLATQSLPEEIRRTILPEGHGMSDTHGDLYVARLDATGRLLTGAGLIFPLGYEARLRARLRDRVLEMFPQLKQIELKFDHVWYGKFAITPDGLPRFQRLAEGVYSWAGCNGRGVALSTALGPALAQVALDGNEQACPLPIEPMQTIAAHGLLKRTAIGALAGYRWRDRRD